MKVKRLRENQSKFVYYSIRERLAIQELCKHQGWNLQEMSEEDGYDSWDAIYFGQGASNIAEVKVRKKESNYFKTNKMILERIKYEQAMSSLQSLIGSHLRLRSKFIVFLFDCVLVWDLTEMNLLFQKEMYRSTSVDGNEDRREKEVTYLNLEDAQRIEYVLDFDKLNFTAKNIFGYMFPHNKKDVLNID